MASQAGSTGRMKAGDPGRRPVPGWADGPSVEARDVVPILPNLLATFAGFLVLLVAPWICLKIHEAVLGDAIVDDKGSTMFANLEVGAYPIIAAVGSSLFLVIGIILQAWQYRRPFPSRWPVLLAFPIALGLIVPEALLREGTIFTGAVIGSAMAGAFAVHWVTLVILREELD